jgi:type I restriction enzyme R subunit
MKLNSTDSGEAAGTESGDSCPLNAGTGEDSRSCGQECPRAFLDPHSEIARHRHRLPHWQQGSVYCFVTWRLADSISTSKLLELKAEQDAWLRYHPKPWDASTEADFHRRFSRRMERWLDEGAGSCVLREPSNAEIEAKTIGHFDGDRYEVACFVVMPNHVHALFRPHENHSLRQIVQSWKGFSARQINSNMHRNGSLWQDEYFDRLIRNEAHFAKCVEYIRENPAKANLQPREFLWFEKVEHSD